MFDKACDLTDREILQRQLEDALKREAEFQRQWEEISGVIEELSGFDGCTVEMASHMVSVWHRAWVAAGGPA